MSGSGSTHFWSVDRASKPDSAHADESDENDESDEQAIDAFLNSLPGGRGVQSPWGCCQCLKA